MRSAYVELLRTRESCFSLRFSRLNKLFIVPFLFQLYFLKCFWFFEEKRSAASLLGILQMSCRGKGKEKKTRYREI